MYLYYYNNNIIVRMNTPQQDIIPTQKDINTIVNTILENNDASKTLVANTVKTIGTIAKSLDTVKDKTNILRKGERIIASYSNIISSVINSLCGNLPEGKNLADMLGQVVETDPKDPDTKKTKYTVIDAAMQIPMIINESLAMITKISQFKAGFMGMLRLRMNIRTIKSAITDTIKLMIDEFSSVIDGDKTDKLLSCLVKQPDIIDEHVKNGYDTDGKKTFDFTVKKNTQGQLGLLDIFDKVFSIIGTINGLTLPRFNVVRRKIKKIRKVLSELTGQLFNLYTEKELDKNSSKIQHIIELITGKKENGELKRPGIFQFMQNLGMIIDKIKEVNIGLSAWIKLRITIAAMKDTIAQLVSFINNDDIDKLSNETIRRNMQKGATSTIEAIKGIAVLLLDISKYGIMLKFLGWGINVLMTVIINFANRLAELEKINITNADVFDDIESILEKLVLIAKRLSIITLLVIPAIVGMIATIIFVMVLSVFCKAVDLVSKWVSANALTTIKNIGEINVLIGTLMLVGVTILLFALITPIIIKAITEYWWQFLMVLGISILITAAVMYIAAKLSVKAAVSAIQLAVNILIIMGSLMMAAMVILVAAAVGNILKDSDAIDTIVLTILGMIGIAIVMVGLGFALTAALPGIALAIGGISPMVVLLGMMVAAGLAMVALSEFDLNFGEYDKKTNTGTGIKGNIGKILEFVDWVYDSIGDKKRSEIRQARRGKRYMRQINKTVNLIKNIAYSIESISKITIDREKLLGDNGTIPLLFKTVEEINTKLFGDGGLMANDTSANYEALDFIMPWRLVSKSVNQKENKANRKLNRINKVISTLNNIGGSLMSIQKLKLDKDVRESIESKIGQMFTFISYLSGKISDFMKPSEEAAVNVSNKDLKKANKKLSKVEAVMLSLKSITDSLKGIGEIKIGSITDKKSLAGKANDNIANVFGATNSLMNTVKAKIEDLEDVDDLEDFAEEMTPVIACIKDLTSQFSGFANINSTQLDKNINSFSGFIDKVNTIDVEKAQKTTQLFKQMSRFSESIKGDFDKLAEALTEKMLPVLEELKDIMDKVPEKLDTGFANTSASISAVNAPATFENVAAQLNRENPDKDKGFIEKLLDKRMAEKAQQEANSTAAKLDELITLLKGFGPQPAVIKTL